MALQRALLLQRVFPSPRPEGESSQMLLLGLTAAMESPGSARTGTSGSPWGNPASPPPGLEQDEGWEQLMSERLSVSWDRKMGCCWYLRTPTFTAGFLQRHQILGHSSHAQPASLVVSPVPGGEKRAAHSGRALKRQPVQSPWAEKRNAAKCSAQQCWAGRAGEFRAAEQALDRGLMSSKVLWGWGGGFDSIA